ncbi:MAG: peptidyl-prolyl cis-trans isomerase [Bacteroidales bacterium]|nr:peptidyl-prolyl cis-trans isomerase [Bacteroidales bacterium]
MRLIYTLVIVSLLAVSCKRETANNVERVVKVGNKYLTREELNNNLPVYTTPEDSILAAEHFIRTWINDNLLYEVAEKNIVDKENIDLLVENYRKSLVIYQYQEQLVNEKLSREINNDEIIEYYENNKDKFQLDRPLIKGIFIKIPVDAPRIEQVRSWYKSTTPASIEKIEKYSVQNAASYDYFMDNWVDFLEFMDNWPVNYRNASDVIHKNAHIEQKDDNYYYFLNITDFLLPGDQAPFEYARSTVKEILINQKKIDFLRQTEENLYNKALNNGQIVFYNE